MQATSLIFPLPKKIQWRAAESTPFVRPKSWRLAGKAIPAWLKKHVGQNAGLQFDSNAAAKIHLHLSHTGFENISDIAIRDQAYTLEIFADGSVEIVSPSQTGLWHGLITLSHLLRAHAAGAQLGALLIHDQPAFRLRGVQLDLAREFFPSLNYLKRIIDRLVDLKINTLWLYIENRFRVPGMEDISPARGMTPKMARQISDYAATRGIDVVPGTNVLSHMEGWFRLERIAQLSDGANHSYPVLTRPEVWDMVRPALDAIADAFPSKNFHAGLDELLFTGTNPQAIDAIETHGKPLYFATFARRVIDHLQARGKTVWIWDDMVMGKNVYRKEGFNDEYQKALDQIPRDVMMTHWYYWTNHDGKHTPIIERVVAAGRPWVVAPSARAHTTEFGSLKITLENQTYMADVGQKQGAFGFVNTNWENRLGVTFAVGWPLLALAGGYAWSGAPEKQEYENQNDILNAWGFVLGGDLHGSLAKYWRHLEAAQDIVRARECDLRHTLIAQGPIEMWRNATTYFKPEDRRAFLTHIDAAVEAWNVASPQDQMLRLALALPWTLARVCVRILDSLDQAWIHYHHAAVIERDASKKAEFIDEIDATVECIEAVENSLVTYRQALETISKTTGHTPYDAITLKRYERDLFELGKLVHRVAASGDGLPHFARLLNRPDFYFGSNAEQIQIQNTFHRPRPYRRWLQLPQ